METVPSVTQYVWDFLLQNDISPKLGYENTGLRNLAITVFLCGNMFVT